jgi:hypothetical protein
VAEDKLLDLLIQVRQQLINRDCRTLYVVWKQYGYSDDENDEEYNIPIPGEKKTGKNIVNKFKNMLDEVE